MIQSILYFFIISQNRLFMLMFHIDMQINHGKTWPIIGPALKLSI